MPSLSSTLRRGAAMLAVLAILLVPATAFAEDARMQPPIPRAATAPKAGPAIGFAKVFILVLAAKLGAPIR